MPKWFSAQVEAIVQETPHVKRFFLRLPEFETFDFKPGQFITMDLPIGEKRLERWRSYSIASAPNDSNLIELCIVQKYDGAGTKYLFENIETGSKLSIKGPDGNFTLPLKKISDHDLIMICTGTGIAPFRSFLEFILLNKIPHQKLNLIFGARYKTDILYKLELEHYKKQLHNFNYDIILSREENWPSKGYVHQVYEQAYENKLDKKIFYLCGWSAMIDEAVQRLKALGVEDKNVVYELYG
jgi:CDP-4-dehydro-6-deoxyglucose reductase